MSSSRVRPDPARSALILHAVTLEWERIRMQLAATHKLTPIDVSALLELRRRHQVRAGELATAVNLSPSGLSALLDRLARAGLAERASDGEDRRSVTVHLTAQGVAVADEALAHPAVARLTAALRAQIPASSPA